MKQNLRTAFLWTIVTTILLGIVYPVAVTGLAQLLMPEKANGSLIRANGKIEGSRLIGQPFVRAGYFHTRPSAAGPAGYDMTASGGSNLAPTNKELIDRVAASAQTLRAENPNAPIPVDLVTTSASGLDPDISPAAAEFQVPRVARERRISEAELRAIILRHTEDRQWGFLGEPRVHVLELNLEMDQLRPLR
jgi:potassium-transporting ATPase KdpC subunit